MYKRQGELFALLGVNGAGKTTTIKMLSCLLRPTSGDALLMGKSIVSQPYEVKKNINVSPQETAIAPNLSVRENLELICGVYGESRSQSKQKAQETITAFGMEEILSLIHIFRRFYFWMSRPLGSMLSPKLQCGSLLKRSTRKKAPRSSSRRTICRILRRSPSGFCSLEKEKF